MINFTLFIRAHYGTLIICETSLTFKNQKEKKKTSRDQKYSNFLGNDFRAAVIELIAL